jgi:hypothetical protein
MASSNVATILPVGVGYGVVVGIGFFFAFVMCGISYLQVSWTRCSPTTDPTELARIDTLGFLRRPAKSLTLPAAASSQG